MRHDRIIPAMAARGQRVTSPERAAALLAPPLATLAHEELCFLHLDREFRILHSARSVGCVEGVEIPVRALVRDALVLGTRALVLAHNHPGGDPRPSRADAAATRRLIEIMRPLDIRIVDHIIVAGERWESFRRLGLL